MASVSTPRPNLSIRPPATRRIYRRQIVMVNATLMLFVVAFSGRHALGPYFDPVMSGVLILVSSSLWYLHLQSAGMPVSWNVVFSALLAGQSVVWICSHPVAEIGDWQRAVGCAAFAYAMLWVFEVHESETGLRSLATAALLLSIGVLSKPPLLICCALLTVAVFFDERQQRGGLLNSALLLLTPVFLCTIGVIALRALAVEGLARLDWTIDTNSFDPAPLHLYSLPWQMPALPFCAAVLGIRLFSRKTGSADLAFLLLLVVLPTLGMAPWMPRPMLPLDITMTMKWGAACLLALDPPMSTFPRLVALASGSYTMYLCRG